jgi:hypothetical protein
LCLLDHGCDVGGVRVGRGKEKHFGLLSLGASSRRIRRGRARYNYSESKNTNQRKLERSGPGARPSLISRCRRIKYTFASIGITNSGSPSAETRSRPTYMALRSFSLQPDYRSESSALQLLSMLTVRARTWIASRTNMRGSVKFKDKRSR